MAEKPSLIHNAMGSAAAGIVSRTLTHPLDTAKARLQDIRTGNTYRGPLDVFRAGNLWSLYRGFGAVIVGGTPGTMLYLCSYELIKERLGGNETDFRVHLASGMLAEAIACIIYVPVDVVKERLQVSSFYRNEWNALQKIARTEGFAGGIYKGYGATLASFGPFSALYFVFYEKLKVWASPSSSLTELSFYQYLLCSCTAGGLASWLTSPLDMAKLRLQIQRGNQATNANTITYRGMVDCLQHTYRSEGVGGLFRGAGARVLHFAPAMTITMTCFETFRDFFEEHM